MSKTEFAIDIEQAGAVSIVRITGYFDEAAGPRVVKAIQSLLRAGHIRVVMDFSSCSVISSPGIGSMIDVAVLITEDFAGRLILVGLDELKRKVFELGGILDLAPAAPDEAEACRLAAL